MLRGAHRAIAESRSRRQSLQASERPTRPLPLSVGLLVSCRPSVCFGQGILNLDEVRRRPDRGDNWPDFSGNLHFREENCRFSAKSAATITPCDSLSLYFYWVSISERDRRDRRDFALITFVGPLTI
jgi:hypothetical protein